MNARTVVVTVVAGRHEHLRRQRAGLAACDPPCDLHVVVALDDPHAADVAAEQPGLATRVVDVPVTPAGLPVAAARNAGARAALAAGADVLVFLDVDCIPAPGLLAALRAAVAARPAALVCGSVTYLPPAPPGGWDAPGLARARDPHPARPDPAPGTVQELDPDLFWSLCFAAGAGLWRRLGGFHEGYVGYGGEDTDFAATAARQGVGTVLAGGADAFHQHHPVSDPPVEHLDDILRNAAVFHRRHGRVPMAGWLAAFERDGLLEPVAGRVPRRSRPVRVLTIPGRHRYLDAVLPGTVARVAPDRVRDWAPDPLFDPDALAAVADDIDVVHLHFGYDHLGGAELRRWLAALDACGLALVVTVHDTRNPHHPTRERHDEHLALLLAAADEVLTLTDAAAEECAARFGRRPRVLPHPTLLDDAELAAAAPTHGQLRARRVLVPLKALRTNVRDPIAVLDAVRQGVSAGGGVVQVLVEPAALSRPELAGLAMRDVQIDLAPYLPHDELVARVAAAHAVVLPYRFGTHSGWLELCRDLGTHAVVPSSGHFAAQWDAASVFRYDERDGLDAASLRAAVTAVLQHDPARPADRAAREAQRDLVRAEHDAIYRALARRPAVPMAATP